MHEESNIKHRYVLVGVPFSDAGRDEESRTLVQVCLDLTSYYMGKGWEKLPYSMEEPDILLLSFRKGLVRLEVRVRSEYY